MAWIELTESLLEDRLTADELSALKTVSVSGSATPLADVVSGVTNEIRGYCSAGGYPRGAGATIPDELLEAAVAISRYRLIVRLPAQKMLMTEDRRTEKNDAIQMLRDLVATGKLGIEDPATQADAVRPPGHDISVVVDGTQTEITRHDMRGL